MIIGIIAAAKIGYGSYTINEIFTGAIFGLVFGKMIGSRYAKIKINKELIKNSQINRCKNCGSQLTINENNEKICEYCGTKY
jgi:Na+/glutamate symporter